jgi:hypothetical protein
MQLTTHQIRQLQLTRRLRDEPPTVSGFFWSGRWRYVYLVALGAIATAFFVWGGWPIVGGFFAGLVLANFQCDLRWYREFVRTWPMSREITNWQRVDDLLNQVQTPAT